MIDAKPYASDAECFVPLMEKFKETYGHYPKYPVADAGYGSYNNYLYCEEHGMEKFMKFTMFEKETKDAKYHNNPYRAVRSSSLRKISMFIITDTVVRKKYMNVKTVQNVHTGPNAVKVHPATGP